MKTLILFESYFGNTEKIARLIGEAFEETEFAICKETKRIGDYDLIIWGAPTRGFRPAPDTAKLLFNSPPKTIQNKNFAVFDTRIDLETIKSGFWRKLVNRGGYAAPAMHKKLKNKGGFLLADPEGFYVLDREGPLKEGEEDRAREWGKMIREVMEK